MQKKVGSYVIDLLNTLGDGSFGKVCLGVEESTKEKVAIKMISKSLLECDEYFATMMANEVKVMQQLRNPNVVQLKDSFESANNLYIVMEYCEGGDLRSLMKKKTIFSEEEAVKMVIDLLKGFEDLLKHGIIHRDLKPENIFIQQGTYKLGDFGFAKSLENFKKELMKSNLGTPIYMSPQLLRNEAYTSKADIWALGVIFFEMLYGFPPFGEGTKFELREIFLHNNKKKVEFPKSFFKSFQMKKSGAITISKNAKNFIVRALGVDEVDRIDWEEVFLHPLFSGFFNYRHSQRIERCEGQFARAIKEINSDVSERKISLIDIFHKYALDKKSLSLSDFAVLLRSYLMDIDREGTEYIFNKFDLRNKNNIDEEDFLKILSDHSTSSVKFLDILKQEDAIQHSPIRVGDQSTIDGFKKLDEFKALVQAYNGGLNEIFMEHDHDKDLKLNRNEFFSCLNHFVVQGLSFSKQEIDNIFTYFDINEDGKINKIEFLDKLQEKWSPPRMNSCRLGSSRDSSINGFYGSSSSTKKERSCNSIPENLSTLARSQILRDLKQVFIKNNAFGEIGMLLNVNRNGVLKLQDFYVLARTATENLIEEELFSTFNMLDVKKIDLVEISYLKYVLENLDIANFKVTSSTENLSGFSLPNVEFIEDFRQRLSVLSLEENISMNARYHQFKKTVFGK